MAETWLRPNRRALAFGCVPPLVLAGVGAWLAFAPGTWPATGWAWIGLLLIAIGLALLGLLLLQLVRPRIAYRYPHVLLYLCLGRPVAVPVNIVEAFFLGQGPAGLPAGSAARQKTMNLMARLSQRETEWAARPVKPALGSWCGGYVTIRGTWCEPLDADVVRRLNRRLKEVKANHTQVPP